MASTEKFSYYWQAEGSSKLVPISSLSNFNQGNFKGIVLYTDQDDLGEDAKCRVGVDCANDLTAAT